MVVEGDASYDWSELAGHACPGHPESPKQLYAEIEKAIGDGDVPDTLQWWLGDQVWRIKTFAVDHDIHTYSCGPNKAGLLELAKQNNLKHYGDVISAQYVLEFSDCANGASVAAVLANAGLANRLEVAAPDFAFWKPDDARYRTQSRPK